jgi:hypothetical protein
MTTIMVPCDDGSDPACLGEVEVEFTRDARLFPYVNFKRRKENGRAVLYSVVVRLPSMGWVEQNRDIFSEDELLEMEECGKPDFELDITAFVGKVCPYCGSCQDYDSDGNPVTDP